MAVASFGMDSRERIKVSEKKRTVVVASPPATYEELIRVIHDRYTDLSNSYQKIALYITQNPNDIAVDSVHVLAEKCGVHASGGGVFLSPLGYKGFKDLQATFGKRLPTAALGKAVRESGRWKTIFIQLFFSIGKNS